MIAEMKVLSQAADLFRKSLEDMLMDSLPTLTGLKPSEAPSSDAVVAEVRLLSAM